MHRRSDCSCTQLGEGWLRGKRKKHRKVAVTRKETLQVLLRASCGLLQESQCGHTGNSAPHPAGWSTAQQLRSPLDPEGYTFPTPQAESHRYRSPHSPPPGPAVLFTPQSTSTSLTVINFSTARLIQRSILLSSPPSMESEQSERLELSQGP